MNIHGNVGLGGSGVIVRYKPIDTPIYTFRYIDEKDNYTISGPGDYNYYEKKKNPPICPCCGAPTKPNLDNCEYCEVFF